jgi:signal transduction histidine kinase
MLDLARIQSGEIPARLAPVDLAEVVRDATTATRNDLRKKNIAVDIDSASMATTVLGDRDMLMQVVLNLLSNAAKVCPAGEGRVSISIAAAGAEWVELSVRDNGPGVPRELREAVFERFRQVGDTLSGNPQGTGLGLSICRMIVTRLGGEIWIDDSPGGGAVFRARLPRVRLAAADQGGTRDVGLSATAPTSYMPR